MTALEQTAIVSRSVDTFLPLTPADRWQRRFVRRTLATDAFVVAACAVVVEWIAVGGGGVTAWVLLLSPLWVVGVAIGGGYDRRFIGIASRDTASELWGAGLALIALVIGAYAAGWQDGRLFAVGFAAAAIGATLGVRWLWRARLRAQRRRGACLQRVLVVGSGRELVRLAADISDAGRSGFEVIGACVTQSMHRGPLDGTSFSVLGGLEDVTAIAALTAADLVAVATDVECDSERLRQLAWELGRSGVELVVTSALVEVAAPRIQVGEVGRHAVLYIRQPKFHGAAEIARSATDRIAAALGLVLLSPVLIGIGIAVATTSKGGALFRQVRVGRNGRLFTLYKFRTMCADAEALLPTLVAANDSTDRVLFKMRADPRVTRVGRLLRRTSLDELPQLINVVAGTMSLVGPRPALPIEVLSYSPDMRRRMLVRPGMTGLWQVSGRSDLSWEQTVQLDLRYVDNRSPRLDALIVVKTLRAVLKSSGAY